MNFFKKKTQVDSGFKAFVSSDFTRSWATRYINNNGSINEQVAHDDMPLPHSSMHNHTLDSLRSLVASLYMEYLGINDKIGSSGEAEHLLMITHMPEGVIIKRIFSRNTSNKWMARWHKHGQEYYASTLSEALRALYKNNDSLRARYEDNLNPKVEATPQVRIDSLDD